MNWIDSHRRVDKGVTAGNCRMDCLLFADELAAYCMRGSSHRVFSSHLIGFLLRANKKERKSTLKRLRYCVT